VKPVRRAHQITARKARHVDQAVLPQPAEGLKRSFRWMSQPRGAGETILVVEDDALVRGFVIGQLHNPWLSHGAAADGVRRSICGKRSALRSVVHRFVMPGGITAASLPTKSADGTRDAILCTSGLYREFDRASRTAQTRARCCYPSISQIRTRPASYLWRLGRHRQKPETGSIPSLIHQANRKLRRDAAGASAFFRLRTLVRQCAFSRWACINAVSRRVPPRGGGETAVGPMPQMPGKWR